ncbi:methylmalonyl-CoA mutase family protein, partial [Arthrospira platensis SPKY1]|nr:methylmalonyl-CoA mutase family protein [Arthrospira platensis SPKY1]
YPVNEATNIDILEVDNTAVRQRQIERLQQLRASRDEQLVQQKLEAIYQGSLGKDNLLALAIEAARARASLGEISFAMERAFGRYQAVQHTISGVYASEIMLDP